MLAAARAMTLLERGEDADREVHAGAGVTDCRPEEGRGLSGQPVTHIAPPMAWAMGSKLLKPLYGPQVPKPFTVA